MASRTSCVGILILAATLITTASLARADDWGPVETKWYHALPQPPYPELARINGIYGHLLVHVVFDRLGKPSSTRIVESSHSQILDLSTRAFIEDHWKMPSEVFRAIQKGQKSEPLEFNVPIEYEKTLKMTTDDARYFRDDREVPEITVEVAHLSSAPLPEMAKRYGIHGMVVLEATFVDDGDMPPEHYVVNATIAGSSGSDLLDLTALSYAGNWALSALPTPLGRKSIWKSSPCYTYLIPVVFKG